MKYDFHVHTKYSGDSLLPLELLRKIAKKEGIMPVITDHDTIKGNIKYGCKIIGEEIRAQEGDIIGLFMMEEIPRGLPMMEVVERIKQQDGLIYVPHPFDTTRKHSSIKEAIERIKPDVIEVFNPRTIKYENNQKAMRYAEEKNIAKAAGSDCHTRFEIGKTYVEMEDFYSKKEFLNNLKKARIITEKAPIWVHALTKTTVSLKNARLL